MFTSTKSKKQSLASKAIAYTLQKKSVGNSGLKKLAIQSKLTIGQPNDKYEQEADQVADQVMAMPQPITSQGANIGSNQEEIQTKSLFPTITPLIQRQAQEEEEELQTKPDIQKQNGPEDEEEPVMAKPNNHGSQTASSSAEGNINQSKGQGNPLPDGPRSFMENRFGTDFSNVRIHSDNNAVQLNKQLNSHAFTKGSDIYFNRGKYNPKSSSGKHLLAHELTHVVQQKGSIRSSIQRKGPRKDGFGKECPDTVVIDSIKPIAKFNKALFDNGIRTWLGIYSYMRVGGPKKKYESCVSEVLKVEENTCGNKSKLADYKPCSPKKHCLSVGGTEHYPADENIFIDMHKSKRKFSLLEGSGKNTCKVTCLQRYGCGGKEIGRFYVTRTFEATTFRDGKKDVPVTLGSIKKVIASRKK